MPESTIAYWNPLRSASAIVWADVEGMEGLAEEMKLSIDGITGEYTRLTRFLPGADTTMLGGKSHDYPEEIFIVSGRLYDATCGRWLEMGDYASLPPRKTYGPFRTATGCVLLKVSFPNRRAAESAPRSASRRRNAMIGLALGAASSTNPSPPTRAQQLDLSSVEPPPTPRVHNRGLVLRVLPHGQPAFPRKDADASVRSNS